MSVPATQKARPAPAVDEAGLGRDADGSQAVGDRVPERHLQRPDRTPPVPGDHPRGLRTPRTPILPLCPRPPAGSRGLLCVSAGTSREDRGEPSRRHRLPYMPPVTGRR
jgi:hypothetical protein